MGYTTNMSIKLKCAFKELYYLFQARCLNHEEEETKINK